MSINKHHDINGVYAPTSYASRVSDSGFSSVSSLIDSLDLIYDGSILVIDHVGERVRRVELTGGRRSGTVEQGHSGNECCAFNSQLD